MWLTREAARWSLDHDGPDRHDPTLYHGRAGVLLALVELRDHEVGDDNDHDGVAADVERLADELAALVEGSSLYFGLRIHVGRWSHQLV